jgi:hypothetical protein
MKFSQATLVRECYETFRSFTDERNEQEPLPILREWLLMIKI